MIQGLEAALGETRLYDFPTGVSSAELQSRAAGPFHQLNEVS